MWRHMGNSKSHFNGSIRGVSPSSGDNSRSLFKHKLVDSAHRPTQLAKSKRSTVARTLFSSSISDQINKSIQPVATSHLIPTPFGVFHPLEPGWTRGTLKNPNTKPSKSLSHPTSDLTDSSHSQKPVSKQPSLPTAPAASQTTRCVSDINSSVQHPYVLKSKQHTQSALSSSTDVRDCQVVPCASNPPSRMSDSESSPQQPLFKYELDGGVFDINEALYYSPAELHRFKHLVGMLEITW